MYQTLIYLFSAATAISAVMLAVLCILTIYSRATANNPRSLIFGVAELKKLRKYGIITAYIAIGFLVIGAILYKFGYSGAGLDLESRFEFAYTFFCLLLFLALITQFILFIVNKAAMPAAEKYSNWGIAGSVFLYTMIFLLIAGVLSGIGVH